VARVLHPVLQLDELALKPEQLPKVSTPERVRIAVRPIRAPAVAVEASVVELEFKLLIDAVEEVFVQSLQQRVVARIGELSHDVALSGKWTQGKWEALGAGHTRAIRARPCGAESARAR